MSSTSKIDMTDAGCGKVHVYSDNFTQKFSFISCLFPVSPLVYRHNGPPIVNGIFFRSPHPANVLWLHETITDFSIGPQKAVESVFFRSSLRKK